VLISRFKDDLIKARNKTRNKPRSRVPVKSSTSMVNKKEELARKSIARSRAGRNASVSAKRGISTSKNPTQKQVEQELYRSQRVVPMKPYSQRLSGDSKTKSDKNMKTRNKKLNIDQFSTLHGKRNNVKTTENKTRPPPKRVVRAAKAAMKNAGFEAPRDMQMVISFVPSGSGKGTGAPSTKQGHNSKKKQQRK